MLLTDRLYHKQANMAQPDPSRLRKVRHITNFNLHLRFLAASWGQLELLLCCLPSVSSVPVGQNKQDVSPTFSRWRHHFMCMFQVKKSMAMIKVVLGERLRARDAAETAETALANLSIEPEPLKDTLTK